jgi:hypothetical protein
MKVMDLVKLIKDDSLLVEINCTEDDFQCVVDITDAFWTYGGRKVKEIKRPTHSNTLMMVVI